MIYKNVLGGRIFHMYWSFRQRPFQPKWLICRATLSEEDAQRHFDQAKAPAWCVEHGADCHAKCYRYAGHLQHSDLDLLLTCRQVHGEAKHVPFSTNTFSFRACVPLRDFLGLNIPFPSQSQCHAVCSIHLNISVGCTEDAESWKMVLPKIAQIFPNLRNINITFHQGTQLFRDGQKSLWDIARDDEAQWKAVIQSLLSLASLPLKTVTFDINDKDIKQRWFLGGGMLLLQGFQPYERAEEPYRWTIGEKQSRVSAIREDLVEVSEHILCSHANVGLR